MSTSSCKRPVTELLSLLSQAYWSVRKFQAICYFSFIVIKLALHIHGSYFVEIIPQKTKNITLISAGHHSACNSRLSGV